MISAGHYIGGTRPNETIANVMGGRAPKLMMDIHSVSEVNRVDLSEISGPASSETFEGNPHAFADNPTDEKTH